MSRGSSWFESGAIDLTRILLGFTILCRFCCCCCCFDDRLGLKYVEAFSPGLVPHFAGWALGIDITEWSNSNQQECKQLLFVKGLGFFVFCFSKSTGDSNLENLSQGSVHFQIALSDVHWNVLTKENYLICSQSTTRLYPTIALSPSNTALKGNSHQQHVIKLHGHSITFLKVS